MFADLILRCFRRKSKTRKLKNVQDVHFLAPLLKISPKLEAWIVIKTNLRFFLIIFSLCKVGR